MTPRDRAPTCDYRALCAALLLAAMSASEAQAEPVLRDLARQPGVIALTLPVTYWDYLGWKDTLASRPLTERQRAYARGRGARQVFTPQAVVDGSGVAVGSDRATLDKLMRDTFQPAGLPVPVRSQLRGGRILVEIGTASDFKAESRGEVWLVPVLRSRAVAIQGGENGGRTATYVNVVRDLQHLGHWSGQAINFDVPDKQAAIGDADSWVVLLQGGGDNRPGRIIGAAKGPGL